MSLCNIPPNVLATLAAIIGIGLAKNLTPEEQNSVAGFLQSIGQTMETVNSQVALIESEKCTGKEISNESVDNDNSIDKNEQIKLKLEELENQVNLLKKQLDYK